MKIHSIQLLRSKISSKLIFASCVWYSDRAHYELCALIKDIGRRLPLQLQCSYQGQQDESSQSVRGNYATRFWGGQNLTAVKGSVSFYQVNLVSRITGKGGGAEFWRTWVYNIFLKILKYTPAVYIYISMPQCPPPPTPRLERPLLPHHPHHRLDLAPHV